MARIGNSCISLSLQVSMDEVRHLLLYRPPLRTLPNWRRSCRPHCGLYWPPTAATVVWFWLRPDGTHARRAGLVVDDSGSHLRAALGDDPAAETKDAYHHGAGRDWFSGDGPVACRHRRRRRLRPSLMASFGSMSTNPSPCFLFRQMLFGPHLTLQSRPLSSCLADASNYLF